MSESSLGQTLLKGNAKALCSAGDAVEFIQPWYTPIETTPDSTGIAIGGIGSSYTLTAGATTPIVSFIPGYHVTHPETGAIALQDWYASEKVLESKPKIEVADFSEYSMIADFYPLFDANGSDIFKGLEDHEEISKALSSCQEDSGFYENNKANLESYKTEWAPRTLDLMANSSDSAAINTAILLDHFAGSVKTASAWASSLTTNIDEESRFGFDTYASEDLENQLLYPQAKLDYTGKAHSVKISRKHYSPVVRDDLKSCSLPSNFIEFDLENPTNETRLVTLTWAQENLSGFSVIKKRPGVQDAGFVLQKTARYQKNSVIAKENFQGILQTQEKEFGDLNGQFAFGLVSVSDDTKYSFTARPTLYSDQLDYSIAESLNTGRLNTRFNRGVFSGREATSSVISVQVELQPNQKATLKFAQIIDYPEIDMPGYKTSKRYTHFFDGSASERLEALIAETSKLSDTLLSTIEKDQAELVDTFAQNSDLKSDLTKKQLTTMAQNTLSFLADATVWDKDNRFLVRECADYPFFNSLDVYFYGSFGMLWLSPELDTATMRYFSEAVLNQEETERRFWIFVNAPTAKLPSKKYVGPRATKGAVIHDLGSPFDPKPDAYDWHNVAEWKDLAPKYILMMLRNYTFTKKTDLLEECWPAIESSIEYLLAMIPKDHHMPLTTGTDDTFDNLSSFGITLYCGSLWVAGLRAAVKIAELINKPQWTDRLTSLSEKALTDLNEALWDKDQDYLHFFSFPVIEDFIGDAQKFDSLSSKLDTEKSDSVIQTLNSFIYKSDYNYSAFLTSKTKELLDSKGIEIKEGTFNASKLVRKAYLLAEGDGILNEAADVLLERESDDSFGDPLLAETYLEMMGLPNILSKEQQNGILEKAYQTNFEANSPHVGYANLTANDGAPKDAFQAQDVWIGVQYSNLASLQLAGDYEKFSHLTDTLYENLYTKSKVPFAAPEGFNSSCTVEEASFDKAIVAKAKELGWILKDGRISEKFPTNFDQFCSDIGDSSKSAELQKQHRELVTTGLKYTAGRYFRPGMVFALPLLMQIKSK